MGEIAELLQPQYLEEVPCNLCARGETVLWAESGGFRIVRCVGCGLTYVNPRLNRAGLQKVYGRDYFEMHTESEALEKRLRMYEIEIRAIEKLAPSGRILDVGCGGGYFLARLGSHWERYGTEFSAVAAHAAHKNFGIRVEVGPLPELAYPDGFFDVVNLRGVIEHFQDPFAYLTAAHRILKPGGWVIINTPNIESFCARLYREKFRLVDPRYHIYYFSTRTISRLAEKAGLRVARTRFFYLGTPYAHWTDALKITLDLARLITRGRGAMGPSPAFFDNVVHVYARKEISRGR